MTKNDIYYRRINRLVDQGRLDIGLIISPPRTSSTLLETSVRSGPDISVAVHEPFISVKSIDQNFDDGYRNIYESIGGKSFEESGQTLKVVIKELSHRLSLEDEYKRLFSLSNRPIVFLIRNPLLSVESRIRKIVQTLPLKTRVSTQQWMLDFYARDNGYNNWQEMDEVLRRKVPGDTGTGEIYSRADLETQEKLLDYYSTKIGFRNWSGLNHYILENQDYRAVDEILQIDPERFILDQIGKGSLEEQVRHTETEGQKAVVVDSTDFRLSPEPIMKDLCRLWSISYNSNMLSWGKRELKLTRSDHEFNDLVWYDKLASSEGIEPPLEIPPTLSDFPASVKIHLDHGDIPQYSRLYRSQNRIEIDDDSKFRRFEIRISSQEASQRLTRLGVISSESTAPSITIQDIDPVYALLNNPELVLDDEYMSRKKEYSDTINILRREGVTRSVEGDYPGRRK